MENMEKEKNTKKFTPRKPDFKGDGVAVWMEKDKDNHDYLSVVVLGGKAIRCFSTKVIEE
jgi:hypothetical protein